MASTTPQAMPSRCGRAHGQALSISGFGFSSSCCIPYCCCDRVPYKAVALPFIVVAPLVVAFDQGRFKVTVCLLPLLGCCPVRWLSPFLRSVSGCLGWARWANFEGATALLSGFPAACVGVMPSGVCGCVVDLRRLRLPFSPCA